MTRGDTQRAFMRAAAHDGIPLERAQVPWINQQGHFGVDALPSATRVLLDGIFNVLGGEPSAQCSKPTTPLPGDFYHRDSGTFIEIDESQHFTSFRALTLGLYPIDVEVAYSLAQYADLCATWAHRSDKYFASKPAVAFGQGGRQRQRAYNDCLRDLVTPALGHPPVIRVAAPERDGATAYAAVRSVMLALI